MCCQLPLHAQHYTCLRAPAFCKLIRALDLSIEAIISLQSYIMCRVTSSDKQTTVLSTKGQVILPQAIRKQWQWSAGTRLTVENTADGVLLRPVPDFPATKPADVFGYLALAGKPKTFTDMERGILSEAKRRHAGEHD